MNTNLTPNQTFHYATDSDSGTIQASSIQAAYDTLRARITPAMAEDGATLWVQSEDGGDRLTMGQNAE